MSFKKVCALAKFVDNIRSSTLLCVCRNSRPNLRMNPSKRKFVFLPANAERIREPFAGFNNFIISINICWLFGTLCNANFRADARIIWRCWCRWQDFGSLEELQMKVRKASHQTHVPHLVHKGAVPGAVTFRRCYSNKKTVVFVYNKQKMTWKENALTHFLLWLWWNKHLCYFVNKTSNKQLLSQAKDTFKHMLLTEKTHTHTIGVNRLNCNCTASWKTNTLLCYQDNWDNVLPAALSGLLLATLCVTSLRVDLRAWMYRFRLQPIVDWR